MGMGCWITQVGCSTIWVGCSTLQPCNNPTYLRARSTEGWGFDVCLPEALLVPQSLSDPIAPRFLPVMSTGWSGRGPPQSLAPMTCCCPSGICCCGCICIMPASLFIPASTGSSQSIIPSAASTVPGCFHSCCCCCCSLICSWGSWSFSRMPVFATETTAAAAAAAAASPGPVSVCTELFAPHTHTG